MRREKPTNHYMDNLKLLLSIWMPRKIIQMRKNKNDGAFFCLTKEKVKGRKERKVYF